MRDATITSAYIAPEVNCMMYGNTIFCGPDGRMPIGTVDDSATPRGSKLMVTLSTPDHMFDLGSDDRPLTTGKWWSVVRRLH